MNHSIDIDAISLITPKPKRAVSISPKVLVKKTTHINNYTDNEIDACWYNKMELKAIRARAMKTAKQIQSYGLSVGDFKELQESYESPTFCTRGLEHFTSEARQTRLQNREEALDIVLEEQERQIEEGIRNEEALAYVYSEFCHSSSVAASVQGLSDHRSIAGSPKKKNEEIWSKSISYKHLRLARC